MNNTAPVVYTYCG